MLEGAGVVHLRTRKHPTVKGLPAHLKLRSFDALYDSGEDFAQVYNTIAERVIALARKGDVIYAVPGHPLVGEATVPLILDRAREAGIVVRLVGGLSFVEPTLEALALHAGGPPRAFDPLNGLQLLDALEIAALHHPPINPDKPALIAQVYSRIVASDLKLTLMNQYPPGHEVLLVRGGPRAAVMRVALHRLDHAERFDHLTSLYVPAMPRVSSLEGFQETMARLRAPEGCPWDREQTHESLRNTLLEEACEVLDAIDSGDMRALQEELGDLLFNVIFQAQMAAEAEEFRMVDVIGEVDEKLKRRHPHVFGSVAVGGVDDVLRNWDAIKKAEERTHGKPKRDSALDGVPKSLPALARSQKLSNRAIRAGFTWGSAEQRWAKIDEEVGEVRAAPDARNRAEEIGDVLFMWANLAEAYGVDAESALRETNAKFTRRFHKVEQFARERGLDLRKLSTDELLGLWREAKAALKPAV